jgi:membrane-associated phospholipid phosphatase
MNKHFGSLIFLCILFINSFAQDSSTTTATNPAFTSTVSNHPFSPQDVYKISWAADAPITGGGIGLSVLGLHLIKTKDDLTDAQAAAKNRNDVPSFDRGNAGFYSQKDNDASYIPFFTSFATPVAVMLINKNERQQAGKILVMYTEALAVTSTLYTITAGSIDRSRPLVYPDKNGNFRAPLSKRESKNSQRSFYAGHTAATATASFFAAKVFCDLNPDSKFKPVIWVIAAALPAVTAYYRYESGQHFLSDNILGYAIGAGVGILVPQFHKTHKNFQRVSFAPAIGQGYKGFNIAYTFK